jgi:hypothetical protein
MPWRKAYLDPCKAVVQASKHHIWIKKNNLLPDVVSAASDARPRSAAQGCHGRRRFPAKTRQGRIRLISAVGGIAFFYQKTNETFRKQYPKRSVVMVIISQSF